MKQSGKLLLSLLLLLSVTTVAAQLKVVESSAKKPPVWFNTMQTDYIITSAIADDIERAKTQCLDLARNYIVDAVAQNVKSSSESTITQESVNSGIVKFLDQFTTSYQTESAKLPYLAGISMSKVEGFYWQKRQDKKTKAVSYLYSIKYPFPSLELKKLVHEFRTRDEAMNESLRKLESQFEAISSVEQIGQAVNDLQPLIAYFFDDTRRNAAIALQRNYQSLYENLIVERTSNEPGREAFRVMLRNKPINSAKGPSAKSETLWQFEVAPDGDLWRLTYDCSTCDPTEENYYDLAWRLGQKSYRNRFYVNIASDKIGLLPKKEIYLQAAERSDSTVTNIRVRINLQAETDTPYIVRSITLDVPQLRNPLQLDSLNFSVNKKGVHNLELNCPGTAEFAPKHQFQVKLVRGHMEVETPGKNTSRIDFSLPLKTNW